MSASERQPIYTNLGLIERNAHQVYPNANLQVRLLLQDEALNPANNLQSLLTRGAGDLPSKNLSFYSDLLTGFRREYWQGKEGDNSEMQMNSWVNGFLYRFQQGKRFFSETEKGRHWDEFLSRLGIHASNTNRDKLHQFYEKYLSDTQGMEKFISDVLEVFSTEGAINLDQVTANEDAISWISAAFGGDMASKILYHLSFGKARSKEDNEGFKHDALNENLDAKGARILEFINSKKTSQSQETGVRANKQHKPAEPVQAHGREAGETLPQAVERPARPISQAAEFTEPVKKLFAKVGINTTYVNPVPIGNGSNHVVYEYNLPQQPKKVIKLPKEKALTSLNEGMSEECENLSIVKGAFHNFVLPTEVLQDVETNKYCIVQDRVEGEPITHFSKVPAVEEQLKQIVKLNHRFYQTHDMSLDFVGTPGFLTWVRRQLKRKGPFEISNLLVNKEGRVYIIDYDLFKFGRGSLRNRLVSRAGFLFNRFVIHHYFGLDIKLGKTPVVLNQSPATS